MHGEDLAVIALLLDRGADINARDKYRQTPLHYAAWKNKEPAVTALLLARGADVNAVNYGDRTPLHHAAYRNEPAVVELLLEHGAISKDTYIGDLIGFGRYGGPCELGVENPRLRGTDVLRRLCR